MWAIVIMMIEYEWVLVWGWLVWWQEQQWPPGHRVQCNTSSCEMTLAVLLPANQWNTVKPTENTSLYILYRQEATSYWHPFFRVSKLTWHVVLGGCGCGLAESDSHVGMKYGNETYLSQGPLSSRHSHVSHTHIGLWRETETEILAVDVLELH